MKTLNLRPSQRVEEIKLAMANLGADFPNICPKEPINMDPWGNDYIRTAQKYIEEHKISPDKEAKENCYKMAGYYYNFAIQHFREKQNWLGLGYALKAYAELNRLEGNHNEAYKKIQKANLLFKRYDAKSWLMETLATTYTILFESKHKFCNQSPNITQEQIESEMNNIIEKFSKVYLHRQARHVNKEAYRVAQGEFAITAEHPIGTENVNDCICVALKNPRNGKVALAHIDNANNVASLTRAMEAISTEQGIDAGLEAKIVGGRLNEQRSNSNIWRVLKLFRSHNINLVSAQISNPNQPTSIVIYPKTFDLKEEIPGLVLENEALRNSMVFLQNSEDENRNVRMSFDTDSKKNNCCALLLSQNEARNFNKMRFFAEDNYTPLPISRDRIFNVLRHEQKYTDVNALHQSLDYFRLLEACQKSYCHVFSALDKVFANLERDEKRIHEEDKMKIRAIILDLPIHIGEGAEHANKPLIDFIAKNVINTADGSIKINSDALQNFSFPRNDNMDTIYNVEKNSRPLPKLNAVLQ